MVRPIYIIDPLGTTRDYDEALATSVLARVAGVRLLTTRFNDRRERAGEGEGYFLRATHRLHRLAPWAPLRLLKAIGALEYVVDLARLAQLARREEAVLHWQWMPFPLLTAPMLGALRAPGPLIYTAHDVRPHDARDRGRLTAGERWRYEASDRVIVHSRGLAAELTALVPALAGRIEVIPHGLIHEEMEAPEPAEARERQELPAGGALVGFVGLLRPHKGLRELIEAWRLGEADRGARARLVIAGEWRDEEWVGEAAEEAGAICGAMAADPTIVFRPGYLSSAAFADVLAAMDVVVLPYRHASQSGIALAAMRYGVPLIATREGGLAELMTGELAQWSVPARDVDALATAIGRFLALDAAGRAEARRAVRAVAAGYSWSAIAGEYARLYEEIRDG